VGIGEGVGVGVTAGAGITTAGGAVGVTGGAAAARTSRVKVDVAVCAGEDESVAVIVKLVLDIVPVGVPLMAPVAGLRVKPAGSAGEIE
jgi:hypothetical protein